MNKLACIIVEDEPLAADILKEYIEAVPSLKLTATVTDAIYAMEVLQSQKIDIMFLDIHLPKIKGLDFLKTLQHKPQVILTTAYRDYALNGFELGVVDYLLKPISFSRFVAAISKIRTPEENSARHQPSAKQYFFINMNKKKIKVWLQDILYIESKREYISIVTESRSYLTKLQIGEVEIMLDDNQFIRIHRSFLIAKNKITAYSATDVELGNKQLPIGRNYKDAVIQYLERGS